MADKININTAIFVHERDENHLYVIGIDQIGKIRDVHNTIYSSRCSRTAKKRPKENYLKT